MKVPQPESIKVIGNLFPLKEKSTQGPGKKKMEQKEKQQRLFALVLFLLNGKNNKLITCLLQFVIFFSFILCPCIAILKMLYGLLEEVHYEKFI